MKLGHRGRQFKEFLKKAFKEKVRNYVMLIIELCWPVVLILSIILTLPKNVQEQKSGYNQLTTLPSSGLNKFLFDKFCLSREPIETYEFNSLYQIEDTNFNDLFNIIDGAMKDDELWPKLKTIFKDSLHFIINKGIEIKPNSTHKNYDFRRILSDFFSDGKAIDLNDCLSSELESSNNEIDISCGNTIFTFRQLLDNKHFMEIAPKIMMISHQLYIQNSTNHRVVMCDKNIKFKNESMYEKKLDDLKSYLNIITIGKTYTDIIYQNHYPISNFSINYTDVIERLETHKILYSPNNDLTQYMVRELICYWKPLRILFSLIKENSEAIQEVKWALSYIICKSSTNIDVCLKNFKDIDQKLSLIDRYMVFPIFYEVVESSFVFKNNSKPPIYPFYGPFANVNFFENKNKSNNKIDYEISMFSNYMIESNVFWDVAFNEDPYTYIDNHWSIIQDLTESLIIKTKSKKENPLVFNKNIKKSFTPCKNATLYDFLKKGLVPTFSIMALMMSGLLMCRNIVIEKNRKLHEYFDCIGLDKFLYMSSTFICNIIFGMISFIPFILILKFQNFIVHTNIMWLFLIFFGMLFSTYCFSYSVALFSNNESFASVFYGTILNVGLIPQNVMFFKNQNIHISIHIIFNLLHQTAFGQILNIIFKVEKERISPVSLDLILTKYDQYDAFPFGYYLFMIFFDGIFYILASHFLIFIYNRVKKLINHIRIKIKNNRLPSQQTRSFDRGKYRALTRENGSSDSMTITDEHNSSVFNVNYDVILRAKNIYCSYDPIRFALSDVSLKLHNNRITTVLGHNGAGKTTLIKTLLGIMEPEMGKIEFSDNSDKNKKIKIGYCGQEDLLLDSLTVYEHLLFYNNVLSDNIENYGDDYYNEILDVMQLTHRKDAYPSQLSGGQKRKLSISISILGEPNIIILDEPTAGVDVESRKKIWELIDKKKKDKAVFVCTHHMDEAEMISDNVIIISDGKIIIDSNPLEIKNKYGLMYKLKIIKNDIEVPTRVIFDFISNIISNIFLLREDGLSITIGIKREERRTGAIEKVLKDLNKDMEMLGILVYAIDDCTLEDAFLQVHNENMYCQRENKKLEDVQNLILKKEQEKNNKKMEEISELSTLLSKKIDGQSFFRSVFYNTKRHFTRLIRDKFLLISQIIVPLITQVIGCLCVVVILYDFYTTTPINITTAAEHHKIIIPVAFSGFQNNSVFSYILNKKTIFNKTDIILHDCPKLINNTCSIYETSITDVKSYDKPKNYYKSKEGKQLYFNFLFNCSVDNYILSTYRLNYHKVYFSLDLKDPNNNINIIVAKEALQSVPISINYINNIILKMNLELEGKKTEDEGITVHNNILWDTSASYIKLKAQLNIALIIMVSIGITLSTSIYVQVPVMDRASGFRKILEMLGVSPLSYWVSLYIFYMILFTIPVTLTLLIFRIFSFNDFISYWSIGQTISSLYLFCFASIPISFIISNITTNPSRAFTIQSILSIFMVLTFSSIESSFDLLEIVPKKTSEFIYNILTMNLFFNFQYSMRQIAENAISRLTYEKFGVGIYKNVSIYYIGKNYVGLVVNGVVLFTLFMIYEYSRRLYNRKTGVKIIKKHREADGPDIEESSDNKNNLLLKISGLYKSYKSLFKQNDVHAVQGIDLDVFTGQCIAVLGVNGAGKTTTFKMISGDESITSGSISLMENLNGVPFTYCSQTDNLDFLLTAREHFNLLCNIYGYSKETTLKIVNIIMSYFEFDEYEGYLVSQLSYGVRRKLSAALTLFGNPSLILMDEPTTGMDPVARAYIWNFVQHQISLNKTVIITTHNVNECDRNCSLVSIMKHGKFRFSGTPVEIKEQFGKGYELNIQGSTKLSQIVFERVNSIFKDSVLMDSKFRTTKIFLPIKCNELHDVFRLMESLRTSIRIEDYFISQADLERMFLEISEDN